MKLRPYLLKRTVIKICRRQLRVPHPTSGLVAATALFLGALLCASDRVSAQTPHQPRAYPHRTVWLGVIVRNMSFDELESLQLDYGVRVREVSSGGPAEKAGIQQGDIILELADKPIYSARRLNWLVDRLPAGAQLPLKYQRGGNVRTAEVRLEQARVPPPWFRPPPHAWDLGRSDPWWGRPSYLGVRLQSMTDELREHFGAREGVGVLVVEVPEGAPAEKAGLVAGDVIIKMANKSIRDIADVYRVLHFFDPGDEIAVEIIRRNEVTTLPVVLSQPPGSSDVEQGKGPQRTLPRYHERWRERYEGLPPLLDPRYWQEGLQQLFEDWEELWREFREREVGQSPYSV